MKVQWPKGAFRWKEALVKYKYVLLVMAVGVLLMAWPSGTPRAAPPPTAEGEETFSLEEFEDRLGQVLSQIEGAGATEVMLTLSGGSRRVLAQDTQQDKEGDSTRTTVTLGRGSGGQEVVALQTVAPQFRGALVVCPGGDDPSVRLQVIQAVSALTGLGSDRISVCQRAG